MFTTSKYALCSFKNSATHVNRLPIEILVRIFSCVMASRPHFGRFPYYLSQTTFGAVCKHWRRITLSSPLLWDFITSCSHPSMIKIALQRSQNVTLKAYIERCEPDLVDLVQPHVSSIKHLTCDFTQGGPASSTGYDISNPRTFESPTMPHHGYGPHSVRLWNSILKNGRQDIAPRVVELPLPLLHPSDGSFHPPHDAYKRITSRDRGSFRDSPPSEEQHSPRGD